MAVAAAQIENLTPLFAATIKGACRSPWLAAGDRSVCGYGCSHVQRDQGGKLIVEDPSLILISRSDNATSSRAGQKTPASGEAWLGSCCPG